MMWLAVASGDHRFAVSPLGLETLQVDSVSVAWTLHGLQGPSPSSCSGQAQAKNAVSLRHVSRFRQFEVSGSAGRDTGVYAPDAPRAAGASSYRHVVQLSLAQEADASSLAAELVFASAKTECGSYGQTHQPKRVQLSSSGTAGRQDVSFLFADGEHAARFASSLHAGLKNYDASKAEEAIGDSAALLSLSPKEPPACLRGGPWDQAALACRRRCRAAAAGGSARLCLRIGPYRLRVLLLAGLRRSPAAHLPLRGLRPAAQAAAEGATLRLRTSCGATRYWWIPPR